MIIEKTAIPQESQKRPAQLASSAERGAGFPARTRWKSAEYEPITTPRAHLENNATIEMWGSHLILGKTATHHVPASSPAGSGSVSLPGLVAVSRRTPTPKSLIKFPRKNVAFLRLSPSLPIMKTLHLLLLLGFLANTPDNLGANPNEAAEKKALAQLQGTWSLVSASADGEAMPESMVKEMKRTLHGNELRVTRSGQVFFKAKVILDATKTPKTIDYEMTEGPTKGNRHLRNRGRYLQIFLRKA
jgi:uncharacterized protein (TIGR03067 family)